MAAAPAPSSAAQPHARPKPDLRVVVFGFDVAEITQIRRIRALRDAGYAVHSFTMRRDNMDAAFVPDWPNTHLFRTRNERIIERAAVVAGAMLKMAGHRATLKSADVIVARNLDMLAIAVAARRLAGVARGAERIPLVYECLDIHGMMTDRGRKGRAMRALERRLLAECDLLVVSSEGFMKNYFQPVQGYDGPWELWENKLVPGPNFPKRPPAGTRSAAALSRDGPVRLGWVGTIRCAPSMALLAETARRMGPGLELHVHGIVHRHVLPDFDAFVAEHPTVTYHGPYRYPDDLRRIYDGCDLVWAQDLWQRGSNSDWLLPNRIYEAPYCGCLSIAVAGTQTGHQVARDALGPVIAAPQAADLAGCLEALTRAGISDWSDRLLTRPAGAYVQHPDDLHRVILRAAGVSMTGHDGGATTAGQEA